MRRDLLILFEKEFFEMYPEGFDHPDMLAIKKKHKLKKMHDMTRGFFAEERFSFIEETIENMIKIISRASMVSLFEKPKFRDFARSLSIDEKELLAQGLYEFLHGDREKGFVMMRDVLQRGKLAKWSLMTIIPYYYSPQEEVFVKPTTAKGIIKTFELKDLLYKPLPNYDFYIKYMKVIKIMRGIVDPSLGPDNAAFSGFLMMMMDRM